MLSADENFRMSPNQMEIFLSQRLGETLVRGMLGLKVRDSLSKHAYSEGDTQILAAAVQAWNLVSAADGDDVARAWFVGANPSFDDRTALTVLREGNLRIVLDAAQNYFEENS